MTARQRRARGCSKSGEMRGMAGQCATHRASVYPRGDARRVERRRERVEQ
jgi:hypothetical protein